MPSPDVVCRPDQLQTSRPGTREAGDILTLLRRTDMTVYEKHGYADRDEYLQHLCEDYDPDAVMTLAELLGPEEDFDGLVIELQEVVW